MVNSSRKPKRKAAGGAPFRHAYAVIMAGGSGTRFWPLSRRKHPKQLLTLFGKETLLEQAVARLQGVIPPSRTYIFTSEWVRDQIVRLLPRVPSRQIVAEPASRNTAPTLGVAAHEILRRDSEAVMVALPADHVIRKPEAFRRALRAACAWASTDGRSVILGIKPTRPDTGFGYVRFGRKAGGAAHESIYHVEKFEEKPDLETAKAYLACGDFCWNAGMFVWRAETLKHNLERFQPEMAAQLEKISGGGGVDGYRFRRIFPQLEKISIDYAIMQKISGVFGVAADIGWSDVGSWGVVHELEKKDDEGNVQPPETIAVKSRGNLILSPHKPVVTVGVQNLVIVETKDALLVCGREHSQDVGKAVQELERRGRKELL